MVDTLKTESGIVNSRVYELQSDLLMIKINNRLRKKYEFKPK